MMFKACPFEKDLTELLRRGQWPKASSPELRAHVSQCRACGDLALVMRSMMAARAESVIAATPGAPGVLWWRAQLRRRKAAMERIGKPILGAQIFALSIVLVIAAVFAVSQAKHGEHWLAWLAQLPHSQAFHLEALWPSAVAMPEWAPLVLISSMAALALVSGLVVFLASERH
jgi:hypothetical protein